MPTKIILDVDTGTDDAVALMVAALSPDIELVGATAVNGNTGVDDTTENTLRVFDLIGRPDIPVFRGMAAPMLRPQGDRGMAAVIHRNLLDLPAATDAGSCGACGGLAGRHVHGVRWRHHARRGRAADERGDGTPEGTEDGRADPGDRDHGWRPREREPDGLGRVQLLGRSRGRPDRRRVRPADPHGAARRDPSRARVARRLRAPASARDRGGERDGGDRRAAHPRVQRDPADGRRIRRARARRPGRLRRHRTCRAHDPAHQGGCRDDLHRWPRDARSAMSARRPKGSRTSSSPSTPTGRGSSRCSSTSSVGSTAPNRGSSAAGTARAPTVPGRSPGTGTGCPCCPRGSRSTRRPRPGHRGRGLRRAAPTRPVGPVAPSSMIRRTVGRVRGLQRPDGVADRDDAANREVRKLEWASREIRSSRRAATTVVVWNPDCRAKIHGFPAASRVTNCAVAAGTAIRRRSTPVPGSTSTAHASPPDTSTYHNAPGATA